MSPKLLWADDDVEFTGLCRRFFERQGFQVRTVDNGFDCLEELRRWSPHLLVVDDRLKWGQTEGGVLASLDAVPLLLSAANCRVVITGEDPQRYGSQDDGFPLCLPKPFYLRTVLELAATDVCHCA
jgi:ActR/RegA family two-component response regulator